MRPPLVHLSISLLFLLTACGGAAAPGASSAPPSAAPSAPAGCPVVTPLALPPQGAGGPGGGPPGGPGGGPPPNFTPGAGGPGGPGGPGGGPGGPGAPQAQGTAAPLPMLAPPPAGAVRFQVVANQSTATFRVREQLAGLSFPNDAVGCTGAVTGQLTLHSSGDVVSAASRIEVDLRALKSDSNQRDDFIKSSVMQTQRFPTASFVPTRAAGGPTPLPASGSATLTLSGQMTIRGVTRDQDWSVTAQRQGNQLSGTATTSFKFGDFNMTPPRVPMVLSIVDDIRLEVKLVATQAS
ncbi:MAG TPA: YceI family protein [Chloroflexota bacterium]|nr:YceI family protein [Chloroflexota bacterium]